MIVSTRSRLNRGGPQGLGQKADTQPSTSDPAPQSCQQTVPQQSTGDELILADSDTEEEEVQHEQEDVSPVQEPRYPHRVRRPPDRYGL